MTRHTKPRWFEPEGSGLYPCPFCGGNPELKQSAINIGSGDIQDIFTIACNCDVGPAVRVRGEAGYAANTERSNEEAERLCRERWNKRTPLRPDMTPEVYGVLAGVKKHAQDILDALDLASVSASEGRIARLHKGQWLYAPCEDLFLIVEREWADGTIGIEGWPDWRCDANGNGSDGRPVLIPVNPPDYGHIRPYSGNAGHGCGRCKCQ